MEKRPVNAIHTSVRSILLCCCFFSQGRIAVFEYDDSCTKMNNQHVRFV